MVKKFFLFLILFLFPQFVSASSFSNMIDFELESRSYYTVWKDYQNSISFCLKYHTIQKENLEELLSFSIKEDNHILYIYDKLYLRDLENNSLERTDVFFGITTNWLSSSMHLSPSDQIVKKEKEYVEIPVYIFQYRLTEEEEWTIYDPLEEEMTVQEFLYKKLNITDASSYYQKLYQFKEISTSDIYNMRIDFYQKLPNIDPIMNEELFYEDYSLKLFQTSYLSFHYQNVLVPSFQMDTSFTKVKEEDNNLISLLTLLTMIIGAMGLLSLKR